MLCYRGVDSLEKDRKGSVLCQEVDSEFINLLSANPQTTEMRIQKKGNQYSASTFQLQEVWRSSL